MRKITAKMYKAFCEGKEASLGNTVVTKDEVILFGHPIVKRHPKHPKTKILVRTWGYETTTTKDRLGAFVPVYQKNHVWYVGDDAWEDNYDWTSFDWDYNVKN
ncbi:MAG: hypothetical protein OEY01_03575 [Desulfobulbaceae bacterium]|nr:hypothetical protein [Desulfobulbaceae bacterium]